MLNFFSARKNKLIINEETSAVNDWIEKEGISEGQLSIDVYHTDKKIIIQSTIAGAQPEDLKISLHHDLLTIHGTRKQPQTVNEDQYLYRECYWGPFSRSIILPAQVDNRKVEAIIENGVLTITLTKVESENITVNFKS
ncbi:Hsp20/alpha crystallin family protein [Patescibacteria group bacterium]|nr:Hsp20/alpha crystallin family protein [Patescibacteria group bacterium]